MGTIRLRRDHVAEGRLPKVCMRCGAPASENVSHRFRTGRGGTWLFLGRLVIWLGNSTPGHIPLCANHRNLFRAPLIAVVSTNLAILALVGLIVLLLVTGLAQQYPLVALPLGFLPFVAMFGGLAWILTTRAKVIRCLNVDGDTMTLANVSDTFIDAVLDRGPLDEPRTFNDVQPGRGRFENQIDRLARIDVPQRTKGRLFIVVGGTLLLVLVGCGVPALGLAWLASLVLLANPGPTAPRPVPPGNPGGPANPNFKHRPGEPVVVKQRPIDPNLNEKDLALVYLSDLPEFDAVVGWGNFGKNGMLGYGLAPGEPDHAITVAGKQYPKGLSMVPRDNSYSTVKYRLGKTAKVFKAFVAVNDLEHGAAGPVTPLSFRVLGDGEVLWISDPHRVVGKTQECRVNVEGVGVLELQVHCPGWLYNARAVWLEPHILK
jgi:hypothetical protein